MGRFELITDGDVSTFLDWINNPRGDIYPSTVVSIVETVRDTLMKQHSITFNEFLNR